MSRYQQLQSAAELIESPPHRPSGVGKLAVFVGTAYLAISEYLRMLDSDVVVISDVEGELSGLVIDPTYTDRVHVIPVGRGHTLHTLFENGTPAERAVIADLPGSPARNGLSRIRIAGGVAFTQITLAESFERLVRQQVIPQLMFLNGGTCESIQVDAYFGMSGGTGSRGGLVALKAHIQALLADTDANIDVHVHLIGAVTFNSPNFDRCRENASEAILDWLAFARRPVDPRVTVVLHLAELLPVGIDKDHRDALAMEAIQAALAPELGREHYLQASNATFSGEFGNVRLNRSGHFRPLPLSRIAADAAQGYLPHVVRTLSTGPDCGRVKTLDWHLETEPLPQESVAGILARLLSADAQELVAAALAPAARHVAAAELHLKDGRKLDLSDARAAFATPLITVRQTAERICLLKTARVLLAAERDDLATLHATIGEELEIATSRLERAILHAQGATWWSLLLSDDAKIRGVQDKLVTVRTLVAELVEVEAKLAGAQASLAALRELLIQLTAKLKRLRKLLRRSLPHGDNRQLPAVIMPRAVDEFWKRLLGLAEERHTDLVAVKRLLAETVRFVLPEGLAAIVGAADASFDAIVRSLNAKTFLQLSPAWGGRERDEPGSTWLVYPPVDPRTAQALAQHHAALKGSASQIGFARTALGSVNVVSLEIRYCQTREDAWPKFYQQGHERALASKHPGFYVCDATAAVEIGIKLPTNGKPARS